MSKRTRYKFAVSEERGGSAKTIAANTTITEAQILNEGYSFFKVNGAYTLTLPAATDELKGVSVIATGNNASSKVTVVAGFAGGGSDFDVVTLGAYGTQKFWCDGDYWYAQSFGVAAS